MELFRITAGPLAGHIVQRRAILQWTDEGAEGAPEAGLFDFGLGWLMPIPLCYVEPAGKGGLIDHLIAKWMRRAPGLGYEVARRQARYWRLRCKTLELRITALKGRVEYATEN